ncbi:tRNA pseudouridine(38/39) synthase [Plutella xylostella]|uniref:tRNA pseudouridine(38/39) synthase n=1 Tax=Plutella xylostella TaxID=51655 RepID=UPI0020323547|nr:tRNA pseudouridine(38/39) synthase [Plutella xylostella]
MSKESVPSKPRRLRGISAEELLKLDKTELVDRIIQLEAHNFQLRNIISKQCPNESSSVHNSKNRPFDFSKCHTRRVLLRILYFGWDYQGLATQEDSPQTIEHHLFYALTRACLIEGRETSQYHRCGRTDKGVSAFGQVISITLRSKFTPEAQNLPESIENEIPYCKLLNRLLPPDIRAVAWMPAPEDRPDFSARFDCKKRIYKYYFPRSNLDIASMRRACAKIVGSHDFRNLCKMDVGNGVVQFIRRVLDADIVPVREGDTDCATSMYCLRIVGNAFLWHQIRCIFGVLLLVGQGRESPDIMSELLDVETNPRKPQYCMALDIPLNLFHCGYEIEEESRWVYDREELRVVIAHLQGVWTVQSIKATMIHDCLQSLEDDYNRRSRKSETENGVCDESERDSIMCHSDCLLQGVKPRVYKPLLKRDTCSSLEERINYYTKKRKPANEALTDETEELDT